jgi:ParB/RepB/Spo0J family partition protein
MATELKHVKLSEIHEPDESLRKVDRDTEKYQGLVDSVRLKGIYNPITVRQLTDPETEKPFYSLVDGLQRFSASKDAGCETIPCHIITVEDGDLLEAQIIANVHKIETKPVEYSKALLKVLQSNPLLARSELANRLAKTPAWISERLGLLKLTDEVGALVDEDKIGLSNAYALAKLPPEEQGDFVDRAMTMPPQQFGPTVNARVKEIRDAKRKGRDAGPAEFQPVPLIRSRAELVSETEKPTRGPTLCKDNKLSTAPQGFAMGVKWCLNLDPVSAEIQKARDEERKAERKRAQEKASVERKRKRAKEAAEKAEALKKEADELEKVEAAATS